jgi:hypothetical protein
MWRNLCIISTIVGKGMCFSIIKKKHWQQINLSLYFDSVKRELCNILTVPHYNENTIYVFPEKELRGLSPDFHIPLFVSIPRMGPHIFLQQSRHRHTDRGNI